jgi:apoptosis-inducing factor 3
MSAKTIAVLDYADLNDGQMYVIKYVSPRPPACDQLLLHRKEVSFDSGKVLLSRLGDNVHATSAFCTHYGAPLVKGVLTADGRVVW